MPALAYSEPAAPDPEPAALPGLAAGETAVIRLENVSKWYGDHVAVSDVSFGIPPGVTGLLGPNGAGKSTILEMMAGLLAPSSGRVVVAGQAVRGNPGAYRRLGLVAEQETVYPFLSGEEFVRLNAVLQKLPHPAAAAARAIDLVEMAEAAGRPVGGYSKGMRQRIKVAAALVHDPEVMLLDEPLNGTDPVQRAGLIDLMKQLGAAGRTVVVSSHVLSEVERFAENILVIINGKLAAAGDFRAIRDRMDQHPREILIRANDPRRLAAALVGDPATRAVRIDPEGRLLAETDDVRAFCTVLPALARREGVRLFEVSPVDESLASVFAYLAAR
jgi:ABC-2 type transport system ATP-binding protein